MIDADFHQFKRKRETRSIKIFASFKEWKNEVLILSSSGPDPVLVHSWSIPSHSNLFKFKVRGSGPRANAIFTVPLITHPTAHPPNFTS